MVERAAAGEAPSSPQPPEAGARRARLYGVSSAAENRNRQTMSSSRCGAGWPMWRRDPVQPTLNMWPTCPWRRGADWLRASARSICRSRMCERTAPRCLFSTMRGLRNLPQLVEGGVRQVEPTIADRQPAVGIIDDGDALAAELAGDLVRLEQEHDLVVLQGQVIGDRPLFAPGEDVGEVIAGRQWPMEVLGVVRFLAEAGVVIGQKTRQQLIAGGNRADP